MFYGPDSGHKTVLPGGIGGSKSAFNEALGLGNSGVGESGRRTFDAYGSTTAAAAAWEASYGYGGWLALERKLGSR